MNINLAAASKSKKTKKKNKLTMGLNPRRSGGAAVSSSNVFGEDSSTEYDDDDDDDDGTNNTTNPSSRAAVNQAIKHEQDALRKRAEEAMRAATRDDEKAIFDYDDAYDSFHQQDKNKSGGKDVDNSKEKPKESRYIRDLLKAAEERKRGRELIIERKIAKEQAEEDAVADYSGKEKFVTAGYKRKLQERELWLAEEERQREEEEANDVTKKKGEAAMATFYGNLNRNVAMGGSGASIEDKGVEASKKQHDEERERKGGGASTGELDKWGQTRKDIVDDVNPADNNKSISLKQHVSPDKEKPTPETMRTIREQKVQQARLRYLQRHGITSGGS